MVAVFNGLNEGLCLAEIELQAEDEEFSKPSWIGQEVSTNKKYSNSHLINNRVI